MQSAEQLSAEKSLGIQRELNKTEEKFLKSQQEVVALKATINELKESVNALKMEHISSTKALEKEHQTAMVRVEDQLVDYESMKMTFDSMQRQLTESQQALSSLRIQSENERQSSKLQIESMERQFKRETAVLENARSKLQSECDGHFDAAKALRENVHSLKRDLDESGRRMKQSEEALNAMTSNLKESRSKMEALRESQNALKMELSESRIVAQHDKQSMDALKEQLVETRRKLEEALKRTVTPTTTPQHGDQSKSGGADQGVKSSMILNLKEFVQRIEDKANDDELSFAEHVESLFIFQQMPCSVNSRDFVV